MRKLRTLRFHYSVATDGGCRFDADGFIRHLMAAVGVSLENLTLIGLDDFRPPNYIRRSMRGFCKLTRLELNLPYFVNSESDFDRFLAEASSDELYDIDDGENRVEGVEQEVEAAEAGEADDGEVDASNEWRRREETPPVTGESEEVRNAWRSVRKQRKKKEEASGVGGVVRWRLVDNLPPTLKTLTIHACLESKHFKCLKAMFEGFEEHRAMSLPALEPVEVHMLKQYIWQCPQRDPALLNRRIQRLFGNLGIVKVFYKEQQERGSRSVIS